MDQSLLSPVTQRGQTRWSAFKKAVTGISRKSLKSPLLDVGCGRGEFVIAALNDGAPARGIDVSEVGIQRFRDAVQESNKDACVAYDGSVFPFPAATFSAMHCWFVFEHLPHPHEVICEMSRVAASGCVLVLDAQDGRTLFEAHAKIPWLPFLTGDFKRAWLDELTDEERQSYIMSSVFSTTGEEVRAVLQFYGWKLHSFAVKNGPYPPPIPLPSSAAEARQAAREASKMMTSGHWPSEPTNYRIVACKR